MSTTVKTGWLNDKNGDKFAPKTLTSQVQTSDGILIEDKIQTDLDTVKQEILDTIDPNTIMNYLGEVDELPETANKGDTYKPSKLKGEECLIITISGVESIVPISSYPDYENYHNPNEAVINCNSDSDIGRFMHSAYSMMEAGNLEASWNISVAGQNWGSVWITTPSFDSNYPHSFLTNLSVEKAQQMFNNGNVAKCTIEMVSFLPSDLQERFESEEIANDNNQLYMYNGSKFIPLGGDIDTITKVIENEIKTRITNCETRITTLESNSSLAGETSGLKKIGFTPECDYVATPTNGRTAFVNAIAEAADGDTIIVMSGEYNGEEELLIDKNIGFVAVGHPVINFPIKTQGGGVFNYENWEWTEIYESKHTKWDGFSFKKSFVVGIECDPDNTYHNGFATVKNCSFNGYTTMVGNCYDCDFNGGITVGHYYGADASTFIDCKFSCSIEANAGGDTFKRCDFHFKGDNSVNITTWKEDTLINCKMYAPNDILTISDNHSSGALNLNDTVIFAVSVVNGSWGEINGGYLISYTPVGGTSSGGATAEYVTRTEMEEYVNETIVGGEW